jgi:DNA-binding SARP family transcriptional activator
VGEDRRSASIGQTVAASLNIGLLGGFRVERADAQWPVCCWQRRSAKTLTKLLATYPRHALHREQVMEILWPNVDPASALNSFGKALYAARRAFQPDLLPRQSSAYLCLTDSMLALNADRVTIDADRFQQLAESALKQCDIESYESALVAYGGELLPEDRYEDWCAERRDYLAGLHIRLLMELADALTHRGSLGAAIDRLHEVLRQDPTREDVHRHLMVLYAEMGSRDQAVRQFQLCEDALRRELGLAPERATLALHADVLEDRIPRRLHVQEPEAVASGRRPERSPERTRFVDRDAVLRMLGERLTRAHAGRGGTIVLSGEAGVGKTRVAAEFSAEAEGRGATVLSAGSGAHATELPYAPFAVALDRHITGRLDHGRVARVLSDLAEEQPVVLVLGDLHDFSRSSVDLLEHLAHLAGRRRWLILGTVREEELEVGNDVWSVIAQMTLEGLCERVTVRRLSRSACDDLVQALLPGGWWMRRCWLIYTRALWATRSLSRSSFTRCSSTASCFPPAAVGGSRVTPRSACLGECARSLRCGQLGWLRAYAACSRWRPPARLRSRSTSCAPVRRHSILRSQRLSSLTASTGRSRCACSRRGTAATPSATRSFARRCTRTCHGTAATSSRPRWPKPSHRARKPAGRGVEWALPILPHA